MKIKLLIWKKAIAEKKTKMKKKKAHGSLLP